MPSGIFGAPIYLEEVNFSLLDGKLVITPLEEYLSTGTYNEKSYKARKHAHKREKTLATGIRRQCDCCFILQPVGPAGRTFKST